MKSLINKKTQQPKSTWEEIVKNQAEINKTTMKNLQRINETKTWLSEKTNKTDE